ncbi:MAG TPA: alpha/beta fold hydrolase [Archangium sp.]|uniref:alpha/beta fold hydrolase n=1 Tax=Archangium sp. TaxID=1872627 RepID=UPI002E2EB47B|nr:alpha/beta fold hydrolase [Archangium sp.]HEX5746151.1 alpha/beta fold hydrolase [Archangium sp.]
MNGARLHYELQGDGFPVVLLHGGLLDLRLWDGQVGPLARHFTTLRYDQRGFGWTVAPEGQPYAPHEDLRALLDHFSMDRTHVVGQSFGGRVALDFALAFPERVSCLVLVAPEWTLDHMRGLAEVHLPHFLEPPAFTRLEQLLVPTLVVVGDKASPALRSNAELLARRVPALTRVTLPGVGHLPNLERPEDFNRVLLGFLLAQASTHVGEAPLG